MDDTTEETIVEETIEAVPKKAKKTYIKTPKQVDLTSKSAKYFINHNLRGMPKAVAAKQAGIKHINNITNIERTETYQTLAAQYADIVKEYMSFEAVALEHIKNIKQDSDKGAKNTAIKMYLDKVEPEVKKATNTEKMLVILRD